MIWARWGRRKANLHSEPGQGTAVGDWRGNTRVLSRAVDSAAQQLRRITSIALPDTGRRRDGRVVHFIRQQCNIGPAGWNNFTVPSSLDLSRFADDGHGILLAWDAGHSQTGRAEPIPAEARCSATRCCAWSCRLNYD